MCWRRRGLLTGKGVYCNGQRWLDLGGDGVDPGMQRWVHVLTNETLRHPLPVGSLILIRSRKGVYAASVQGEILVTHATASITCRVVQPANIADEQFMSRTDEIARGSPRRQGCFLLLSIDAKLLECARFVR